jgi:hypothetical protein
MSIVPISSGVRFQNRTPAVFQEYAYRLIVYPITTTIDRRFGDIRELMSIVPISSGVRFQNRTPAVFQELAYILI